MVYRIVHPAIPDQSTGEGVATLGEQLFALGAESFSYSFADDVLTVDGPGNIDLSRYGEAIVIATT